MPKWVSAGAIYFAVIFALGFVLGTIRVFVTAPITGDLWATLIELPVMLSASWWWCVQTMKHFQVAPKFAVRVGVGLLALTLLLGAEAALSVAAFGRDLETHFAGYMKAGPMLGLLAQLAFAAFPFLQSLLDQG
jgi:hypothetical protein